MTEAASAKQASPLRNSTLLVVALCVVIFIIYVVTDRLAPSTNNARVMGYVVPLAGEVSGVLTEVNVSNNQIVQKGQVLAQIAQEEYLLAVNEAEAALEIAGQEIGAGTAGVSAAQARLLEATSSYKAVLTDANRLFAIEDQNLVPKQRIDQARSDLEKAEATVAKAQAELEQAKQRLGATGEDNPKLQQALARLGKARLNLSHTQIVAPADGGITNLQLEAGYFANKGQPLMTFVTTGEVWVEAYMRENNLANIKAGDQAEISLDVLPGRVFKGEVASVGFAVNFGQNSNLGALPSTPQQSGWLRDPQRFPVIIRFTDEEAFGYRRVGAQAEVAVYSEAASLTKLWSKLMLRVKSYFSYVY